MRRLRDFIGRHLSLTASPFLSGGGLLGLLILSTYCSTSHSDGSTDSAVVTKEAGADSSPSFEASSSPPAAQTPNIVFVLTDDLSWNLVDHMPNVTKMMNDGMTFDHYFVTDSLCCPSRSSIFTGKYPHNTGVFTNDGDAGGYATFERLGNATETFAVALKSAGYQTRMMGKYLNGYDPQANQSDPGWIHWDVAGNGYPEYNYWLNRDGDAGYYGSAADDYLTNVLRGFALPFIRETPGAFMLEVATFAPHAPYIPAPRDVGTYDAGLPPNPAFNAANTNPPRWLATWGPLGANAIAQLNEGYNKREEAVQAVDRMIGDIRSTLATTGLDKSTYIVFSSDNGYHMGDHQLHAGKQTAFDTDIRVPLIVVGPGVRAGVTLDKIVENIDLCPTFAAIAGTAPPSTADGHSLLPLLDGETVADWRNVALVEHKGPEFSQMLPGDPDNEVLDGGVVGSQPNSYEALRLGESNSITHADSVFVLYQDGETEYYDLATDPHEMNNTVSELTSAQVSTLKNAVARLQTCVGTADCWAAQHL